MSAAHTALNDSSEETKKTVEDRREALRQANEELDTDACEKERDEIQSNLNCMASVSPAVLQAYEKRKTEVRSFSFLLPFFDLDTDSALAPS